MNEKDNEVCKCENSSGCYAQMEEWGYWLICNDCSKKIEDSFQYYSDPEIE